jgi:hypothetical protein
VLAKFFNQLLQGLRCLLGQSLGWTAEPSSIAMGESSRMCMLCLWNAVAVSCSANCCPGGSRTHDHCPSTCNLEHDHACTCGEGSRHCYKACTSLAHLALLALDVSADAWIVAPLEFALPATTHSLCLFGEIVPLVMNKLQIGSLCIIITFHIPVGSHLGEKIKIF